MPDRKILAIVSVVGNDQKGIVAQVSTFLAGLDVNIEDIEQRVLQGIFLMNMLVEISDLSRPLDELITELKVLGGKLSVDIKVHLYGKHKEKSVVVMVTKEPHCLERLIADQQGSELNGTISAVLSNHDVLRPTAEKAGLPFIHFSNPDREKRDDEILAKLDELKPDVIVLARYMQILPPRFVQSWTNKIINIHPSLLPYHPGPNAYKQAWELGRRVAGCTAHFVTEGLDEGPIILQDVFHIEVGEDHLDDVKRKGRRLEAIVLSKAVQLYLNDELLVRDNKVVFKPGLDFFKKHHEM